MSEIERARQMVQRAQRIVVFTGAGISTDSGIPDFRGPNGVWTKNPAAEKASTLQHYLADPELRKLAWQNRLYSPAWAAQPNAAHLAIVELERRGQLDAVVTQNIDELHQRAGSDPAKVIEVHGTMHWSRCWKCGDRRPMLDVLERVRGGELDPPCELCGGVLKSDTISFGQALVPEVIEAALAAADRCDLLRRPHAWHHRSGSRRGSVRPLSGRRGLGQPVRSPWQVPRSSRDSTRIPGRRA